MVLRTLCPGTGPQHGFSRFMIMRSSDDDVDSSWASRNGTTGLWIRRPRCNCFFDPTHNLGSNQLADTALQATLLPSCHCTRSADQVAVAPKDQLPLSHRCMRGLLLHRALLSSKQHLIEPLLFSAKSTVTFYLVGHSLTVCDIFASLVTY